MIAHVARVVDDIVAMHQEIVALTGDGEPLAPLPSGASSEAIARVEQVRGRELPLSYVEFLRRHDGWSDIPYGPDLFGTDDLCGPTYDGAEELFGYASDGDDVPKKIRKGMLIGAGDHEYLFLTRRGKVLSYRYGEVERYLDLPNYLGAQLRSLREYRDGIAKAVRDAEAGWDPVLRAAGESELLEILRGEVGPPPATPEPVTPPPAADPMPDAVAATDLVVPGRDDDKEDDDKEKDEEPATPRAEVVLNLVLYLGSYPSPDEVLASYRAFRRHFPVPGPLKWAVPDRYFLQMHDAPDPDDESWTTALRVNRSGLFGLRASVRTPEPDPLGFTSASLVPRSVVGSRYTINVCGVPPTDDGRPRASFCEVMLPPYEDPRRLVALARELTDILPVRSGHGGLTAYADGEDDDAWGEVYRWCRRFLGLNVGYLDGWLEAATTRVVGAGWLTVLGPTFATVLGDGAPLRFGSPDVGVDVGAGGAVITAGPAPTLGDVERGEFPTAMAEVERRLRPVKVGGWHRQSTLYTSGIAFDVLQSQLPGAFADHRMTEAWLDRLVDPAAFLGPTPRERGVALLERLHAEHPGDQLEQWRRDDAAGSAGGAGQEGHASFGDLLRAISGAVMADPTSDTGLAALEYLTSFGEDTPTEAYNNLIYVYLKRGRLDDAVRFLPTALRYARKNPYLMHNAADVRARTGDLDGALKLLKRAKKLRYELFDTIRTDEDLRALWGDPRFTALFDD
jgi:hypothetical protein